MKIEELRKVKTLTYLSGPETGKIKTILTDSRENLENCGFLALKGEKFDGHDFIETSIQKGAKVIIGKKKKLIPFINKYKNITFLSSEDTLKSYGEIAKWWRDKFKIPLIFITGSVGKTTIKEMLKQVFEKKYIVKTNLKNENNEIGVPKTLLTLDENTEIIILESGMNHKGELERLAYYSSPDIVLISKICESHIGLLGSLEAIAEAKAEPLKYLSKNGYCYILENLKFQHIFNRYFKRITYLNTYESNYYINDIDFEFENVRDFSFPKKMHITAIVDSKPVEYTLNSPNSYDAKNSLFVFPLMKIFDRLEMQDIKESLSNFKNIDLRSKLKIINNIFFWVDCYNANYTSITESLNGFFMVHNRGKKKLVIGEIKELGVFSEKYHQKLGIFLNNHVDKFDELYLLGEGCKYTYEKFNYKSIAKLYIDLEKLCKDLYVTSFEGDAIFLKGSRANQLEKIIHYFILKKEGKIS